VKVLWACLLAVATAFALACAPDMPVAGSGPESSYEALDHEILDSNRFEIPPRRLDPEEVLTPKQREGTGFLVSEIRYGTGFIYIYSIKTPAGILEARGLGLLRKRIHEIETMNALEEADVGDTDVYALAFANAAGAPAEGGMQLLVHPIRTTSNIPKGMWSMARNYYEMTGAGRTHLEDHYFHELIGFGRAKREWSYRLGVDPYSRNFQMQDELDRLAWLSLAGGLSVRLPLMAVPGGASIALTVTNTSDDMKRELRDETPETIRIRNRKALIANFGVKEEIAEAFVNHSWYSPSAQLEIVESLNAMTDVENRNAFIELSVYPDTTTEAISFTRLAPILLGFHQNVEPLDNLFSAAGFIAGRTRDGNIVVPLYLDFGYWTEGAARVVETIDREIQSTPAIDGPLKHLLISGSLSPRAKKEASDRGWTVMERLEGTWLKEFDRKSFAPGEPDENRILPEIGS
jgi:hypothetical protein